MAIAARRPMMTTTMRSSISVNTLREITVEASTARKGADRNPNSPRPDSHNSGHPGWLMQEPLSSLRVHPICSRPDTYDQRHPQLGCRFHVTFHQFPRVSLFPLRHLDDQLVVHLQEHPSRQVLIAEALRNADH